MEEWGQRVLSVQRKSTLPFSLTNETLTLTPPPHRAMCPARKTTLPRLPFREGDHVTKSWTIRCKEKLQSGASRKLLRKGNPFTLFLLE